MIEEIDFSDREQFPGVKGNIFDVVLKGVNRIALIPSPVFFLVLAVVAAVPSWGDWKLWLILLSFMCLDWALIGLLPFFKKSYGPAQPSVLLIAIARAILTLLPPVLSWGIQILGSVLIIYGFYIEPHHLTISHQKLRSPLIKKGKPLRLLHLGDLHIERISRREIELNETIKSLQPDVILFSGDILNLSYLNDPTAWDHARKIISEWKAPLGVYFVSGSPAVDLEENLPKILDGLPIRLLQNESVDISWGDNTIDLVGITCTHRPHVDGPKIPQCLSANNHRFSILLYHTPDLAPIAAKHKIDLQLSGHTHGGQVRIPLFGALFTGSLYGKQFEAGRYQIGEMTLYITRGIGMEGEGAPRVRLFCPPEIILWEIDGDSD